MSNWHTISESRFSWEREALEFIRIQFPKHEPYQAWSNFEFVADDGSVNEVDLLVFTPMGLFLIEIKSQPGELAGDAGTWTWRHEGKIRTMDSPLIATNSKAKKLKGLLERQKAIRATNHRMPYLEALVFCSAEGLQVNLRENGRMRICGRGEESPRALPAILGAITRRACPGLEREPRGILNRPMSKAIAQAMEQAGVRASRRQKKVSDYELMEIVSEGPGYQDWSAKHVSLPNVQRRIRIYLVHRSATPEDRKTIQRAAEREVQLLDLLRHPGILPVYGYTEHELGPALIFDFDREAERLDHFLKENRETLGIGERLTIVRKLGEVLRYAHEKKIVHRSLSPRSVLIRRIGSEFKLQIFNWQLGFRSGTPSSEASRIVTGTSHGDRLIDDESTAYIAPEALSAGEVLGEHLDVFSLGAVAYHVFSGEAPAPNGLELVEKLRASKGLQISSILNGAPQTLQNLLHLSTHPDVSVRTDSIDEFLRGLDEVEGELTDPHDQDDPLSAKLGDTLPGNYCVMRRIGEGASSIALLVKRDEKEFVAKVANSPENNQRIKDEAAVLKGLRHPRIVTFLEQRQMGEHEALLVQPVYSDKEKRLIETLAQRIKQDGRLGIDLLHRFGGDLLDAACYLEEEGIPHRDIKPDNIAVGKVGRGDALHIVVFDFSLSRAAADNLRAGTRGYLDPMLPLRKPPRWDWHAERYSVAVTLYEMATGSQPLWGDGQTDPSFLDCEATIDAELFDPNIRDSLAAFFRKALRRDPAARFDNAEDMRRVWRECFENTEETQFDADETDDALREKVGAAGFETSVQALGLGARAGNALDRINVLTVADLLRVPERKLFRMRGVGNKTRRLIAQSMQLLRDRLGLPPEGGVTSSIPSTTVAEALDPASASLDRIVTGLLESADGKKRSVAETLLGLSSEEKEPWPTQTDAAGTLHTTPASINQALTHLQAVWARREDLASVRTEIASMLVSNGGVMSASELAESVLMARGSTHSEPRRTKHARAVLRAAVEVERAADDAGFLFRRSRETVIIALSQDLADFAMRLGKEADRLANEDPLAAPARAVTTLASVSAPEGTSISEHRLLRLAVAASSDAAISSRQEIYPRGMSAARALKLSMGALAGVSELSDNQIRERVASRYPAAEALPVRPELDALLAEAGLNFRWDGSVYKDSSTSSSAATGSRFHRLATLIGAPAQREITPEEADARLFEDKLTRSRQSGGYLVLVAEPRRHSIAADELCRRFDVEPVDVEELFLQALREKADENKVNWDLVLKADANRSGQDWNNLMRLVQMALSSIETHLLSRKKHILCLYAGVIARYNAIDLLDRLRDSAGTRGGIPGVWLLVPGSEAMLDGQTIPIIGAGQKAVIPDGWLRNIHRAGALSA